MALRYLVDVAGDHAALGAPHLALVLRMLLGSAARLVHACSWSLKALYEGRRTLAMFGDRRTTGASSSGLGGGELVRRRQIEVAVVAPQPLGDECRGRAAEHGRLAPRPPERQAAQEPSRECVAAPCRVDHLDLEGGDLLAPLAVDDQRAVGAAGGDHAADPAID